MKDLSLVPEKCVRCKRLAHTRPEYPVRFGPAGHVPPAPTSANICFECQDCGISWMRRATNAEAKQLQSWLMQSRPASS